VKRWRLGRLWGPEAEGVPVKPATQPSELQPASEPPAPPEMQATIPEEKPEMPETALSGKEVFVQKSTPGDIQLSPSVRRLVAEKNLDVSKIAGTGPGGRISKGDVLLYLEDAPGGIPEKVASQVCEEPSAVQATEEVKGSKCPPSASGLQNGFWSPSKIRPCLRLSMR